MEIPVDTLQIKIKNIFETHRGYFTFKSSEKVHEMVLGIIKLAFNTKIYNFTFH